MALCACLAGAARAATPAAAPAAPAASLNVLVFPADSSSFAASGAEGLPIRSIELVPRNIFDPIPPGPLRPIYHIANALHLRTREGTLRDQLLLRTGDPWSLEHSREAARHLRTLDFLEPTRLEAHVIDDSVDVRVETRDVWTTQPDFSFERVSGLQFGAFGFSEHNLLGLGKSVSVAYRHDPIGISRGFSYDDPGIAGSRMRIHYGAARGTGGATDQIAVGVPFYAEETPWSLGGSAVRTARQAHLFQNNVEVARLDEHLEETEAFLGHGWRNDSGVKRVTGSLYSLERRLGPTVWDTTGAPPPASQIGPAEELRLRRIAVEVRFWKPKYVERTGVERVDRVEDFDLGPSLAIKIGLAPRLFGSTADEGYVRIGLDAGAQTRAGFGTLRSSISSRLRGGPLEVIEQADGRWVWQENFDHTVVASLVGIAGHEVPRSFQVVVGGLNGLRAYPVHAVAGTQMVRWNLEDRRILVRDIFHLVSVGEAMFVDGARGWGAGSEGSGAYNAAGFGVRLGPPRAALGPAFRIDFAWPLSPTRDGRRDPVVSFGSTHAF